MLKTHQQSKSSRSRWWRFLYAFATIVTVFAQISAALPLLVTAADVRVPAEVGAGLKASVYDQDGGTYTIKVEGKKPANGETFNVKVLGTGLTLLDTPTNNLNGSGTGTTASGWLVKNVGNNILQVTRDDSYRPPFSGSEITSTKTDMPVYLKFLVGGSGGVEIEGSDQPPLTTGETNTLKLGVYNNGPTTYTTGQTVNMQVSDENMISGGEVDVVSADVSKYLKYDRNQTVTQLQKMGYSSETVDTKEVQTLAPDAGSAKVEKFAKADGTYFYLIDNNGDARIAWPESTGDKPRIAGIAMVAVGAMATTTLTPKYLSGSLKDSVGAGIALTITQPKAPKPVEVDGTKLKFDVHSITEVHYSDKFGIYRLSTFPLFYMKEDTNGTALYSFVVNPAANDVNKIRKAVLTGNPPYSVNGTKDGSNWGGAEAMTNEYPAQFDNFYQVGADGNIVSGITKQFESGKTYKLIPYNPVPGTTDRYRRIQSAYSGKLYYMPDGVPTFSLDQNGNFVVDKVNSATTSNGDGNALSGQWYATGKTLQTQLYRIKTVQVVDQNGDTVSGTQLKLKNTTAGKSIYMKTITERDEFNKADISGQLVPSDYDPSKLGPFYYAAGTQSFDSLTFAKPGYTSDIAFDMNMKSPDDKLELTNQKNAKISDDGQTLILTVHKITDADTKLNIQKVAQADPNKPLPDAKFRLEDVTKGATPLASQTATTGADGKTQLTIDTGKVAKRVFHVTETTAPTGYDIGRTDGYYATWEAGKGFTAVGEADTATAATSTDKLASVKDGLLTIQDPTTKVVPKSAVTLKKVSASDPTKALPGATFSFQEVVNNVEGSATMVTSDKSGTVTYMAPDDGKLHIYKVTETAAPTGYAKVKDPYVIQWQNGKIFGFGSKTSDAGEHAPGYMDATLDKASGVLTVQDKSLAAMQTSTLTTQVVNTVGNDVQTSVAGIDLTLSNPQQGGSGTPLKLTTGADGNAKVTGQQVADALGLGVDKMTGTVDLRLTVGNGGQYTAPIARNVKYTFAGGSGVAGFSVYNGANDDKMVTGGQTPGDLFALLRHDTFTVHGISDQDEDLGAVAGAKFTMTFAPTAGGPSYTTNELEIPAGGVLNLPNPDVLLDQGDVVAPNVNYNVTVKLTQAPEGYTAVTADSPQITLTYNSARGYQRMSDLDAQVTNALVSTQRSNGIRTNTVTTYFFGGSDITYYLLKQVNSLAFSNLPTNNELNLNFGSREIQPLNQDIQLDPANDESPFNKEVHPTTTLADDPSKVGIGVTQKGKYADGWTVQLEADALTSEDGKDTVAGASLVFNDGQGTLDQVAKADLFKNKLLKVGLGQGEATPMFGADGLTAGQFNAAWNLNNVKLHVPGGEGLPNTHYSANMTWNLIVGGP